MLLKELENVPEQSFDPFKLFFSLHLSYGCNVNKSFSISNIFIQNQYLTSCILSALKYASAV